MSNNKDERFIECMFAEPLTPTADYQANAGTAVAVVSAHRFRFLNTKTAPMLVKEVFADNYEVFRKKIKFRPGDVILDLGANEGMFSILMSRFFPETRILAYEPIPATFATLQENIELNGCKNIEAFQLGVGMAGSNAALFNVSKDYSGGSTAVCKFNPQEQYQVTAPLVPLDDIFSFVVGGRCRLLKMDIEGMEYEVLYSSGVLPSVDYMVAEVHINACLDYLGRRADGLLNWLGQRVELIHVDVCKMTD